MRESDNQKITDYIAKRGVTTDDFLHEMNERCKGGKVKIENAFKESIITQDKAESIKGNFDKLYSLLHNDLTNTYPKLTFKDLMEVFMDKSDPNNPRNIFQPDLHIESTVLVARERKAIKPDDADRVAYGKRAVNDHKDSEFYKKKGWIEMADNSISEANRKADRSFR